MRRGHARFLADALGPDHDVLEIEVDVRKRGQELGVEARRALVSLPACAGAEHLVDAVLGEGRDQTREVAIVLRDRVGLPELADLGVLVLIDGSPEQLEDAIAGHARSFISGASTAARAADRARSSRLPARFLRWSFQTPFARIAGVARVGDRPERVSRSHGVVALRRPGSGVAGEDRPQKHRNEHHDDHPGEHVFVTLIEHVFDCQGAQRSAGSSCSTVVVRRGFDTAAKSIVAPGAHVPTCRERRARRRASLAPPMPSRRAEPGAVGRTRRRGHERPTASHMRVARASSPR